MAGRILAVGNLKSGTGKTTVAINLGCSLASPRRELVLIDADSLKGGKPTEPAIAPEPEPPPSPRPQAPPQKPSDITAYWRQLKNGRPFPSWSDLDSKLIAESWPNSMLLSCGAETRRLTLDSLFTQALRVENHGADANRAEGVDFTPMLTEWVLSLGREAQRLGKPMQDTDALPSVSGEVSYRVTALPLSDDQHRVDHVLCHVDRA